MFARHFKKKNACCGSHSIFWNYFFPWYPLAIIRKMLRKSQHRSLCLVTPVVSCFALHIVIKEEWLVSKYLSTQGRPDPRGGLCCFGCLDKTSTSLICTFGALKIVKGVKNTKNKSLKATKPIPEHPKHSLCIVFSLLDF